MTVGVASVLRPLYIRQFSPIDISGQLGSLNQVMFSLGLIYTFAQTFFFSLFMSPEIYWRFVYAFPIVLELIQIYNIHVNYPFETIKYLLEQHDREEALKLAKIVYYDEYAEQRLVDVQRGIDLAQKKRDSEISIQMMEIGVDKPKVKRKGKSNKCAVWAAYHLHILQQMTGIQIIIIYAGEIIIKIWPSIQKTLPIVLHTVGLWASYQTIRLITHYGRKEILQKGTAILACFSIIFFILFKWKYSVQTEGTIVFLPNFIFVALFIIYRMVFSATLGPVCWIYLPEIVENDVIGNASMLNWFTAALISLTFPILVEVLGGPEWVFLFLGLFMMMSYYINERLLVQTKGKSEWQIRDEYDRMLKEM